MTEIPAKESELHPDDHFSVERLQVKCPLCQEYCERSRCAELDGEQYSVYVYGCPSPGCGGAVTLRVPRSAAAQRDVPQLAAVQETELHPDDIVGIAQLDVLCHGPAAHCARASRRDEGERTVYLFGCLDAACSSVIEVLVPRTSGVA